MDAQKITDFAQLLRTNGDKILSSEFTLTLSASLLRALNDAFTLISNSLDVDESQNFQVVKPMNTASPVFRDLQLIHDFVQKTALLCLVEYPGDEYHGPIDLSKFRALKRLELKKIDVKQVKGITRLRAQLQHVMCIKSIKAVDDIITCCGGDNSNGFVWNELKIADFSYNNLLRVDTSLEFAQYLQYLNLRHNQLQSVEAVKWLPNLKSLDVSFNRLTQIPQFHMDAYKRLQFLNMSNNLVDDIRGIVKLNALTDLDLSDNCLLNHTYLLPLRALMTLKVLNLSGNPLHCHPKHRLTTAKYLHKNCSTLKFVLDFDIMSKSEMAAMGSVGSVVQQATMSSLYAFRMRSPTSSISTRTRLSSTMTATPPSSVGSLISFKLPSDTESRCSSNETSVVQKKKSTKTRCAEIEDHVCKDEDTIFLVENVMNASTTSFSSNLDNVTDTDHLQTKQKILELREKYGNGWLHSGKAEMRRTLEGNLTPIAINIDEERQMSHELFNEFMCYTKSSSTNSNSAIVRSSTPITNALDITFGPTVVSPITQLQESPKSNSLPYKSLDESQTLVDRTEKTIYKSVEESKTLENNSFAGSEEEVGARGGHKDSNQDGLADNLDDHFKYVYSSVENDETVCSESEDDEETYIVYNSTDDKPLFLTMSANFLREKDSLTERTYAKWSLKIVESCDRIKSNILRINFDTVKKDKQERIYRIEEDLCQELEKKLRDILSQRNLTEMNQTVYRCLNCNNKFSREIKNKISNMEIHCTTCKSTFVAEIHEIPKSLEKTRSLDEKLSPAAIVEEQPSTTASLSGPDKISDDLAYDSNSIGNGKIWLTANNSPLQATTTLKQINKRSATSLNGSSCSKITSNSESSFNSNQSLVGSSNTDRDLDFKGNGESDVDIISNPSQSSIEVLEQVSSRKTSEECRISHVPNLETIDDQSYTQTFLEREFDNMINYAKKDEPEEYLGNENYQQLQSNDSRGEKKKNQKKMFVLNNLTESSSSGSVTDSVCTAYEQKDGLTPIENTKMIAQEFLQKEKQGNENNVMTSKEDSNGGLASMFGALVQSTNVLMNSSKKLIDPEKVSNIQTGSVIEPQQAAKSINSGNALSSHPFKFNYIDFNDVDHRLKLYFYQTKFEEKEEHFKWLVKGRIYIESSKQLFEGVVIVTTCKLYIMESFAAESDDVSKWLRPITTYTVDRLEAIQILPWKLGVSFYLRGWGGFILLLQDILRTDSLMLYILSNALPPLCELKYQPNEELVKRLNSSVMDERLNMCSILNGCEISCENAKRSMNVCCLLSTDSRLYLSSQKLDWLSVGDMDQQQECSNANNDEDIELCVTQFMSNLIEVEHCSAKVFNLNFLDEAQDKYELWKCTFETPENADTCLNAIAQSWEKLFSVPLISA